VAGAIRDLQAVRTRAGVRLLVTRNDDRPLLLAPRPSARPAGTLAARD
jgi:hypothetical protein